MRVSNISMHALVAGMILFAAATSAVALSSTATGYMVEVHTCAKDHSGTDSTIDMSLDILDVNGTPRSLGPWRQNICGVDDHEANDYDKYFFPTPKTDYASRIGYLILTSDGALRKPGWCWDEHYVTYIEDGQPLKTWAWERESPWIYEGTTTYDFHYDSPGRPIPPDVHVVTQDDQNDECPPTPSSNGYVDATISIDVYNTITCGTGLFWLDEGRPQQVSGEYYSAGNYPGYGRCWYHTFFTEVFPGTHRVEFSGYTACESTNVTADQVSYVTLFPYRWSCY